MTTIPFVTSDWRRDTPQEPVLKVQNRIFEANPSNFAEGSSLITRPGFEYFGTVGSGPVLSMYSQESAFGDDLFVLTPTQATRVTGVPVVTSIATTGSGFGSAIAHNNQGAFTGAIGGIPSYFYFAGTNSLWVTADSTFARNNLFRTGIILPTAQVRIGDMYYEYTAGSVDAGTPAGTAVNPWLVAVGSGGSLGTLAKAVNVLGNPGVDYSTATTKNTRVNAGNYNTSTLAFFANIAGSVGNSIPVSVTSTFVLSWDNTPTFAGGGSVSPELANRVWYPDLTGNDGIQAVASLGGYIILAIRSSASETSGRFYWIEPGETYVDPLNFATAELAPDSIESVRVIGEQVWFIGKETLEVWVLTGNSNAPFRRVQGRTANIGAQEGTDQTIQDNLIVVGGDGIVYMFNGSQQKIISTSAINNQIREFLKLPAGGFLDVKFRSTWCESDGHIMYFLYLGRSGTLCYDLTTDQWSSWVNYESKYLQQHAFVAWHDYMANPAVVADVNSGTLWLMEPDYRFDDSNDPLKDPYLIPCVVTAGVPMRMRDTQKCNELYLTGSVGDPSAFLAFLVDGDGAYLLDGDGAYLTEFSLPITFSTTYPETVTLEISDDNGNSWVAATDVLVNPGDYSQEIVWRSLGLVKAPGRLFRISDYNALVRLDGLDMR